MIPRERQDDCLFLLSFVVYHRDRLLAFVENGSNMNLLPFECLSGSAAECIPKPVQLNLGLAAFSSQHLLGHSISKHFSQAPPLFLRLVPLLVVHRCELWSIRGPI